MYVIHSTVTNNPIAYFITLEGAQNYMRLVDESKVYMVYRGDMK
jgi:hypothetical protein